MLPRPRILAIDDDEMHVRAIADALNAQGIACLRLHFNGGVQPPEKPLQIRVLFVDLHLTQPGLGGDAKIHFSTIGGILTEYIAADNGPFILIVWTSYPQDVEGLAAFLAERLQEFPWAIPVAVERLSKTDHLANNQVVDTAAFMGAIQQFLSRLPAVDALVDWEDRVASAASATIAAVLALASGKNQPESELARIMNALATEAVGAPHVGKHRFGAVNEALLPILYDRAVHLKELPERKCWERTIPKPGSPADVDLAEAARLNALMHLDTDTGHCRKTERGVALTRDDATWQEDAFRAWFGISKSDFISRQVKLSTGAAYRWMLVQVQASCDSAQGMPGPAPYLLGVECTDKIARDLELGISVWQSPPLDIEGVPRRILLSHRFAVTLTKQAVQDFTIRYRFREALANDVVARWHAYGARPGVVSFRAKTANTHVTGHPFPYVKF